MVAKVVDLDGEGVFDSDFSRKALSVNRDYYYAIQHFKVVTAANDTFIIAYVFDTKTQFGVAVKNFSIKKDSVYEFMLYDLRPCCSDFPCLIGCIYKGDSLYVPHKSAVITKPYSRILRIIDLVPIQHNLWMELCEYYKDLLHH